MLAHSPFIWDRLLKPYQKASPFFSEFNLPTAPASIAPSQGQPVLRQTTWPGADSQPVQVLRISSTTERCLWWPWACSPWLSLSSSLFALCCL